MGTMPESVIAKVPLMRRYILDASLTPPKDASDAPEGLMTLAKTCRQIIAG
jgi:hypothetical protein